MSKVDPWFTNAACATRRDKLCIAYDCEYDHATRTHVVSVFSVQNGRTPSPLGVLKFKDHEWSAFFKLVNKQWEDLGYPLPNDEYPELDY